MTEQTKQILDNASSKMQKALDYFEDELANVRAGKASTNLLNGVMVDYYGAPTPVSQVASVTVPDAKTVIIQPWEKNLIRAIEKAIIDSNIGLAPSNNGEQIRLTMPPLTEERRKQLVKQVRGSAENARVTLRNIRRDAVDAFKKAQKDGMPEDEAKSGEGEAIAMGSFLSGMERAVQSVDNPFHWLYLHRNQYGLQLDSYPYHNAGMYLLVDNHRLVLPSSV